VFHLGLESGIAGAETENVTPPHIVFVRFYNVIVNVCVNALFSFYRHKSIFYR
jgi:hypothetical protein